MNSFQSDLGLGQSSWSAGDIVLGTDKKQLFVSGSVDDEHCFIQKVENNNVVPVWDVQKSSGTCPSLHPFGSSLLYGGIKKNLSAADTGYIGRYHELSKSVLEPLWLGADEYPHKIAGSGPAFYLVSSSTMEDDDSSDHYFPNWLSKFYQGSPLPGTLLVTQYLANQSTITPQWQQKLVATSSGDSGQPRPILPAGILEFPNFLVVAGSTRGLGEWFGDADDSGDYDGFVTLLDKPSGSVYSPRFRRKLLLRNLQEVGVQHGSARLGSDADDYILRICSDPSSSTPEIYAVGAKADKGQNDGKSAQAFVLKLSILEPAQIHETWFREWDVPSVASHCVVHQDKLYVGGVASDTPIASHTNAHGKDDIWLAQVDTISSKINWIHQYGSSQDDRLADMTVLGNELIVYATTRGNWMGEPIASQELVMASYYLTSGKSTGEKENGIAPEVEYDDDAFLDDDHTEQDAPGMNDTADEYDDDAFVDDDAMLDDDYTEQDAPGMNDIAGEYDYEFVDDDMGGPGLPAPTTNSSNSGFLPGYDSATATTANNNDLPQTEIHESSTTATAFHGMGYQSDMGPSYAGGMVYDFTRHEVYVTGQTYGEIRQKDQSVCFFLKIRMATWQYTEVPYTNSDVCSPMAQFNDHLYMGGIQEQPSPNSDSHQYGAISHLERSTSRPDWNIVNTALLNGSQVEVPLVIVASSDNSIYVASIISEEGSLSQTHLETLAKNPNGFPNLTSGGHLKYGSVYSIKVDHLLPSGEDPNSFKVDTISTLHGKDDNALIVVSGMALVGDQLLVAGSSLGRVNVDGGEQVTNGGNDMNGFVFKMNTSGLPPAKQLHSRFDSAEHENDWIMNICSTPDKEVYVVGATMGNMGSSSNTKSVDGSVHSFATKLDVETLEPLWTRQLYVKEKGGTSAAFGCSVVPNQGFIYVAGVVKNGATMDYPSVKSAGLDDVFVAQLNTTDGNIRWLKQLGSAGHESLARSGGVLVDMEGNAILYGDTTGELYRARSFSSEEADLFIATLDRTDGSYATTIESSEATTTLHIVAAIIGSVIFILAISWYFVSYSSSERRQKKADARLLEEADGLMPVLKRGLVDFKNGLQHRPDCPTEEDQLSLTGRRLV